MKIFLFGITLIAATFIYLAFSAAGSNSKLSELEDMPSNKKEEILTAIKKITTSKKVDMSRNLASSFNTDEEFQADQAIEDEVENLIEEKRDIIKSADNYIREYSNYHTDEEVLKLQDTLLQMQMTISIIKIYMAGHDARRSDDLEDKFESLVNSFESMMKE